MNEKTALEIFEQNISEKAVGIERCGVGHGNYVYIISGETDKYVVRCSDEAGAYADTVYWLERLKTVDIPVPEVITSGKYQDCDYIILSYIAGEDLGVVYSELSSDEKRTIAEEVIRIQNSAASLEPDDIEDGWTWNTFIRDMLERAKYRIELNGYFDSNRVERLREMGGELQDYFDQIKPTAYLDDISTKNLLIEKGRVSGIIDVDWIGLGDSLTFAAMTNVALLNMDCDTDYVEYLLEAMNISQIERKAFIFYSLLYCVDFMGERGMCFGDKRIDVNEEIISRLNQIYDKLMAEWNNCKTTEQG